MSRDNVREGARQAFGDYVTTIYDYTQADVVLSLDADFLCVGPGAVRYSHDFMVRRKVRTNSTDGHTPETMSRLYSVESMITSTGAVADHRLPIKSGDVESFARALAAALNVPGAPTASGVSDNAKAWLAALVRDLEAHRGKSIVVAGDHQPVAVHALVHAINERLGNIGQTVRLIEPIEARPENQLAGFKTLVDDMKAGRVDLLFILGGNPVFNAPADLDFMLPLIKFRCGCTWVFTTTRRPTAANGISTKPTRLSLGAMPEPTTARFRSANLASLHFITAIALWNWLQFLRPMSTKLLSPAKTW